MSELLYFVLGTIIGGLVGIVFMCMLQVNKITEYECRIKELINKEDK